MNIRAVKFRVGTEARVGGLFSPQQPGPVPAVLILHGFPGVQQNEDIAAELCRRGMAVFMPHFRGSWGSAGTYSVEALSTDAEAALRLLARYHHVHGQKIGLLGYSAGGWIALRLAASHSVAAIVAMAPACPRLDSPADKSYVRKNARVVRAPAARVIWNEYLDAAGHEHPEEYIPRIAPTPLLFIQGMADELVPPASTARLFALAGEPKRLIAFAHEGHEFQNDRSSVVETVARWLEERLVRAPEREPALLGLSVV